MAAEKSAAAEEKCDAGSSSEAGASVSLGSAGMGEDFNSPLAVEGVVNVSKKERVVGSASSEGTDRRDGQSLRLWPMMTT